MYEYESIIRQIYESRTIDIWSNMNTGQELFCTEEFQFLPSVEQESVVKKHGQNSLFIQSNFMGKKSRSTYAHFFMVWGASDGLNFHVFG